MTQRFSLTRIVALNWYGFRQIFDVDENVLISGAYGTGKSALLDLMQYVLLGEHWRANRAASGNARGRDLVGYCLGDTNQVLNGERHFVRPSGVTLVALEFTRPADKSRREPQRETWGIRLEYSSAQAQPKHTYFLIPDRVDYAALAPGSQMLDDDAFRTWIRRDYGKDCLFARQQDYLAEMATARHLYFDAQAFQRTFPKAIAFEPEENVEKFIREFILEESPLDVRDVRTALRAYDETRRRLMRQENEAAGLERICGHHDEYVLNRREEAVLHHTGQALRLSQAEERRDQTADQLRRLRESNADDRRQLDQAVADSESNEKLLAAVRFEIQKDPEQQKIAGLDARKRELQELVGQLQTARLSARRQLEDRHHRWMEWLRHGNSLSLDGLKAALNLDDSLLATLRSGTDDERLATLSSLSQAFNETWRATADLLRPVQQEIESGEKRLRQVAEDLENLARGQAPGSFPVFQAIRQKMGDRVEQLGRLIEVNPEAERWWPALELVLGRNRWVMVVQNDADYREALEILRKTAPGREAEALLNPAEARSLMAKVQPGSLAGKIEVKHAIARAFADHLLGDVLAVEDAAELERCESPRAVTPEGLLKHSPLRTRLRGGGTVELTLGREGLERMRQAKTREQAEVRAEVEVLKQRKRDVETWLDAGKKGGLGDATLPDRASELQQLPGLEKDLARTQATLDLLLTPERADRQQQLNDLESRGRTLNERIGGLRSSSAGFTKKEREHEESLAEAEQEVLQSRLSAEESRTALTRGFEGILEQELVARRTALRTRFPRWVDCIAAAAEQSGLAGRRAVEAREHRNQERLRLASERDEEGQLRHPQYQHDFPAEDEANDAWSSRLRVLATVELEKSRVLADSCQREWERRLQESVLNELNRRVSDAQQTIKLLDRYLSAPVGKSRYRISQRRDPAFGALWRLLDSGLEPTDPLSAAIQESEVQRAKDELMAAVDAADGADDRARRLLDYRNYHHYDIEIVPADKPEAPPISLSRSGRNLSGGENQAPFFISMLAAFRRVYDLGRSGSHHLGLVVMDEAFSKLSGDGIEDCLALARNFQLQLIMAFPPERLGVMVPHAQTVIMCQKEVERDTSGYTRRISNIPLRVTMAEAIEALA